MYRNSVHTGVSTLGTPIWTGATLVPAITGTAPVPEMMDLGMKSQKKQGERWFWSVVAFLFYSYWSEISALW